MPSERVMYMHTVDSVPAFFDERAQVIYRWTQFNRANVTLVPSLAALRRQQERSRQTRAAMGYHDNDYGYARVQVPR